ncbi:MAG TPA: SDR family oxidoreductase [Bryobacterales bacterium]|nr:SDR family oxidoreductase [Bryobacterales bacterium]
MTDVGQTLQAHEILLTGGNGFLGKVVLGLLLERFPDLKRLHLLMRSKRNLTARDRFYQETLASPALAPLVEKRGRAFFEEKISVVAGDVAEPNCGLAASDLDSLAGKAGVILNCAGLVEFYPPLEEAFRANVDGVAHVVELAKRLGARLAHVSTCFVCGEGDGLVEETQPIPGFYPRRKGPSDASFDCHAEIRYCRERMRQIRGSRGGEPGAAAARSKEITRRLTDLGRQRAEHWGWVNTYTYSKSLGEQIIAAEKDLAWTIIRPAIIEGALRFPFPGWIEGGRTSAPLVLMALSGLKHWPVRRDAPLEVTPVDLVASAILVITAALVSGRHEPVYQLGTADVNPILLEPLVEMLAGEVRFVSPEQARTRRVRLQKRLSRAQTVLAGVKKKLDTTGLPGKGPLAGLSTALRARGLQASLREQTLEQYLPFILHNRYIFESENIRAAYSLLSERDRRMLPWDPERIDWEDYWINNQVKGIEKWIQPEAVKEWALKI